ncbi:Uncharacterised protein [Mycobacterium tuberculosis]|nr:Uncharacterised protein [Mycobacterium tuberculosis]
MLSSSTRSLSTMERNRSRPLPPAKSVRPIARSNRVSPVNTMSLSLLVACRTRKTTDPRV